MQISVNATPIAISAFDFINDKGEQVKFTKITFVDVEGMIFPINTQDAKFIELAKSSLMKEMKNIPLKLTANKAGTLKLSY